MSKNEKTPTQKLVPPAAKDGIRTRFDPHTEQHLRQEAKRLGYPNVQAYIRELARRDRIKNNP